MRLVKLSDVTAEMASKYAWPIWSTAAFRGSFKCLNGFSSAGDLEAVLVSTGLNDS